VETYFERYVASGGIMMYFLIPCSFFALWFAIQGLINLRRARVAPERIRTLLASCEKSRDAAPFRQMVEKDESTLSRVLRRLMEIRPMPSAEEWRDIAAEFINEEVSRLYHKNNQLSVIYTIAPLLGLLGTILGMMDTFYIFAMSDQHSIAQLSRGINQALVTTLWGLSIAIPSFVVLYLLKQKLFYYETSLLPETIKNLMEQINALENKSTLSDADGSHEKAS